MAPNRITVRSWRLALLVLVAVGVCLPLAAGGTAAAKTSSDPLLAWGFNCCGQLGNNSTNDSSLPVKVKLPRGTRIVRMATGFDHTLAVTSTGEVLAWGDDSSGELGNGETDSGNLTPVRVKLPKATKVVAVAAGNQDSLALTSAGRVLAWGYNGWGALGDGSTNDSALPVRVKLPKGTKAVAVGAGLDHALAATSTGGVLAWGYDGNGQLGTAKVTGPAQCSPCSTTPVKVALPKGTKAVAVAGGWAHSVALTSTGSMLAWGYNLNGELGNGKTNNSPQPVRVRLPRGTKAVALSAGYEQSLALTSTGAVLDWGYNANGELGNGTTNTSSLPVRVKLGKKIKAVAIAGGEDHGLAITSTGTLFAWGENQYGQLGDGTNTGPQQCGVAPPVGCSLTPVKVDLPPGDKATLVGSGPYSDFSLAAVHHT